MNQKDGLSGLDRSKGISAHGVLYQVWASLAEACLFFCNACSRMISSANWRGECDRPGMNLVRSAFPGFGIAILGMAFAAFSAQAGGPDTTKPTTPTNFT